MRLGTIFAAGGLCLALLTGAASAQTGADWTRYDNARFGYAIDVPTRGFTAAPPPENDDGLIWRSDDGAARITAFGADNALGRSPSGYIDYILESGRYGEVTYRRTGENWFVLSGYLRDEPSTIFYSKALFNADASALSGFEITYPRGAKARYDPIVERMEDSLRAPR